MAYGEFLRQNLDLKVELGRSKDDIENLFKKELGPVYLVDTAPQLEKPVFRHPSDPNLVVQLTVPRKHNEDKATTDNTFQ